MKRFSDAEAPSIIVPPPRTALASVPGALLRTDVKSRPFGMRSMMSAWMLTAAAFALTSMSGDSAVTCTDSVMPAMGSAKSTFSVCPRLSWMSETFLVVNPDRVADTS